MEANHQAKPKQNGSKRSDEKGKNPSFPFYTGDWMKDPELRSVSAEARGLWIDLLCLMWDSSDRGYLVARSGKPYRPEHLARMTGVPEGRVEELIAEMEEVGLFSRRDSDDAIYNRRIARKAELSKTRAEAGSKGGSNSGATGDQSQSKTEANDEAKVEQNRLPSSSSSSSPSGSTPLTPQGGKRRSAPQRGSSSAYLLRSKIDQAKEQLSEMEKATIADAFGPKYSPEQKAKRKELRQRIADWGKQMMEIDE